MAAVKENSSTQRYFPYSQRMANEFNVVGIDHCYAKPWSSHPDASNARPLQSLFMDKNARSNLSERKRSEDELVDVDGEDESLPPLYDVPKARVMMSECELHASILRPDLSDSKDDWEDHFAAVRTSWTIQQNRFFAKIMKVLQADRLARLSIVGVKDEPILRRLQIDKAAKRIRFAFGTVGWDKTLSCWLHNLLLDKLKGQLLTSYIEVLQKLRSKIPSLIDGVLEGVSSKQAILASESISGLLKHNWDPAIASINNQKLKKLPDNPLLLLIHGIPVTQTNPTLNKRYKFWQNQLASMGKVINVGPVNNLTVPVANFVESMITNTRSKILEMKGHFPARLIVLIGWNIGALVAIHVSLVEVVHAIVCLGFPTMGIKGNRGEVDDPLLNCKTPSLFVIGQHASATNLDCLEDWRERLRVETGLVLVGGSDDQLRMMRAKKRKCCLTQAMVDRCILDEVSDFLGGILSQAVMQPRNPEDCETGKKQTKKRKQKDLSITAGSQTVERPVKQPKKVKPMKMANVGTGSLVTSALGKKGSPKKRIHKVPVSGKGVAQKSFLHLALPVMKSQQPVQPSVSSTPSLSEAAAIASAPELSTLLQSIKTSTENSLTTQSKTPVPTFISSKISSTSLLSSAPSPNVPTTTALTLSKFLASSGLLKCDDPMLKDDDLSSTGPITANDLKSLSDPLPDDLDLEELSGQDDSTVKQTSQNLVPIKTNSISLSSPSTTYGRIPISVSGKAVKSGFVIKPGIEIPQGQEHESVSKTITSLLFSSNEPVSSNPQSGVIVSEASKSMPVCISEDSGPLPISSVPSSPQASVITIGGDTVSLKERPPSTASAPATVSIDLGEIATGNSGGGVKLQTSAPMTSRISLIPSAKHIPLSISLSSSSSASSSTSSSPDRHHLSSPVSFSKPTTTSFSHQTPSQQVVTISKPRPRLPVASSSIRLLTSTITPASSQVPTILQASPRHGLPGITNTQLMSTLSSSAGLIRFKVTSAQSLKNQIHKIETKSKDESTGMASADTDPFLQSSRLPTFIDLTEENTSPPEMKKATRTVSALSGGQTLSLLSLKTVQNPSTNVIITPSGSGVRQISNVGLKPNISTNSNTNANILSPSSTSKVIDGVVSGSTAVAVASSPVCISKITSLPKTSVYVPKTIPSQDVSSEIKDFESQCQEKQDQSQTVHTPEKVTAPDSKLLAVSQLTPIIPSCGTVTAPSKAGKSSVNTYTATPKPVLSTVASTRTRRIKVPKQYDL